MTSDPLASGASAGAGATVAHIESNLAPVWLLGQL